MPSALEKLEGVLEEVGSGVSDGRFRPHNEEDVSGYIYHTWLVRWQEDILKLHLEARVPGYKNPRGHADLAYGDEGKDRKGRPTVRKPEIVVEVKCLEGFTPGQVATRKRRFLDDIRELGRLEGHGVARVCVLFGRIGERLPEGYLEEAQRLADLQPNDVLLRLLDFNSVRR